MSFLLFFISSYKFIDNSCYLFSNLQHLSGKAFSSWSFFLEIVVEEVQNVDIISTIVCSSFLHCLFFYAFQKTVGMILLAERSTLAFFGATGPEKRTISIAGLHWVVVNPRDDAKICPCCGRRMTNTPPTLRLQLRLWSIVGKRGYLSHAQLIIEN